MGSREEVDKTTSAETSFEEMFETVLPYYLSIGMTCQQFYEENPKLTVIFREAEKIRNNNQNEFLWLQGVYVRDALAEVLNKCLGGKKNIKYPNKPYPLTKEDMERQEEEEQAQRIENLRQSLLKQKKGGR